MNVACKILLEYMFLNRFLGNAPFVLMFCMVGFTHCSKPTDATTSSAEVRDSVVVETAEVHIDPALINFFDFGGNSKSEPLSSGNDLYTTTLSHQRDYPMACDLGNFQSVKSGCYDIRKRAYQWLTPKGASCEDWYTDFGDHTSPDDPERGYMLQVDLGSSPAILFKGWTCGLPTECRYRFSFWAHPVDPKRDVKLTVIVDGYNDSLLVSKEVIIEGGKNEWQEFSVEFQTSYRDHHVLVTLMGEGGGGSFALDDLAMKCADGDCRFLDANHRREALEEKKYLVLSDYLYFEYDSKELIESYDAKFENIVNFAKKNSTHTIWLLGFSDERGRDDYNMKLSQDRINVVAERLVKMGLPRSNMKMMPFGSSMPKKVNAQLESEFQRDRRVSIYVFPKSLFVDEEDHLHGFEYYFM